MHGAGLGVGHAYLGGVASEQPSDVVSRKRHDAGIEGMKNEIYSIQGRFWRGNIRFPQTTEKEKMGFQFPDLRSARVLATLVLFN